jgi:hypothetical protein
VEPLEAVAPPEEVQELLEAIAPPADPETSPDPVAMDGPLVIEVDTAELEPHPRLTPSHE